MSDNPFERLYQFGKQILREAESGRERDAVQRIAWLNHFRTLLNECDAFPAEPFPVREVEVRLRPAEQAAEELLRFEKTPEEWRRAALMFAKSLDCDLRLLRQKIPHVQQVDAPEPPVDWEGPYFEDITSIDPLLKWLRLEIVNCEEDAKIGRGKEAGGKSIRNLYRLVDKLAITGLPPLPETSLTRDQERNILCNRQKEIKQLARSAMSNNDKPQKSAPLSRLDLPRIVEAVQELHRIIAHPPADPWQPPTWLVEQFKRTTLGEAGLRAMGMPTHAALIDQAATEVLNRMMPPWHHTGDDCPEITESLLDQRDKLTLIELRNRLLGSFGFGQILAENRTEAIQVLAFLESVLHRLGVDASTQVAGPTVCASCGKPFHDQPALDQATGRYDVEVSSFCRECRGFPDDAFIHMELDWINHRGNPEAPWQCQEWPEVRHFARQLFKQIEFEERTWQALKDWLQAVHGIRGGKMWQVKRAEVVALLRTAISEPPRDVAFVNDIKSPPVQRIEVASESDPLPAVSSLTNEEFADRLAKLEPARRKAYLAYQYACGISEKTNLTVSGAYETLKEVDFSSDSVDWGELTDYKLPRLDSFSRYLTEARRNLNDPVYTRRRGRPHGGSIIKSDQIEYRDSGKG